MYSRKVILFLIFFGLISASGYTVDITVLSADHSLFGGGPYLSVNGRLLLPSDTGTGGYMGLLGVKDRKYVFTPHGVFRISSKESVELIREFEPGAGDVAFSKEKAMVLFPDKILIFTATDESIKEIPGKYFFACRGEKIILIKSTGGYYLLNDNKLEKTTLAFSISPGEKHFILSEQHYHIDLNGDLYAEEEMLVQNRRIESCIFSPGGHSPYFSGIGVFDINGSETLTETVLPSIPRGQVYRVFRNSKGIIVSTYDNGAYLYEKGGWSLTEESLISGYEGDTPVLRIRTDGSFNNDEILRKEGKYYFGVNGIYLKDSSTFLSGEEFFFSDVILNRGLVSSFNSGLYNLEEGALKKIETSFRGVSRLIELENKEIIIASNDGLFRYDGQVFTRVTGSGPVTDIFKDERGIYVSLYKRGIYVYDGKELLETKLSIRGLNGYFVKGKTVCELFGDIFVVENENY